MVGDLSILSISTQPGALLKCTPGHGMLASRLRDSFNYTQGAWSGVSLVEYIGLVTSLLIHRKKKKCELARMQPTLPPKKV
jgi:hypothetical protein